MPGNLGQPPYKVYRSGPRGLRERLRGEDEALVPPPGGNGNYTRYSTRRGFRGWFSRRGDRLPGERKKITPGRVLKYVIGLIVFWLVLSLVLFILSAETQQG